MIVRSLSTNANASNDKTSPVGEYVLEIVTVLRDVANLLVTAAILGRCSALKSASSTLTVISPLTITLGSSASVLISDSTYSKVATLLIVIF